MRPRLPSASPATAPLSGHSTPTPTSQHGKCHWMDPSSLVLLCRFSGSLLTIRCSRPQPGMKPFTILTGVHDSSGDTARHSTTAPAGSWTPTRWWRVEGKSGWCWSPGGLWPCPGVRGRDRLLKCPSGSPLRFVFLGELRVWPRLPGHSQRHGQPRPFLVDWRSASRSL